MIAVAVASTIMTSCSEEDEKIEVESLITTTNLGFEFSVENNILNFPDEANYEKAINYLAETENFNFLVEANFNSFLKTNPTTEVDEIFASLLSENKEIIVGHHLFEVDFEEEVTRVFEVGNKNLRANPSLFSFDDNFFEMLENENARTTASYCTSNKEKTKSFYPFHSNERIEAKNVFQRFTIYNSLQVKIKKEGTNYGTTEIYYKVESGSYYKRRNRRITTLSQKSGGGSGRSYNKRIYEGTRRLEKYDIDATFDAVDISTNASYTWGLDIKCN